MNKLLEIDSDIKAIVSKGYLNDPVMSDYKEYGFRALVSKPYRLDELRQALQKVME